MRTFWQKMEGKKTYVLAALGALVWFAQALGWLDSATAVQAWTLLGFGSAAALRHGMK